MVGERRFDALAITHQQEVETFVLAAGKCGAFNHDAHAFIAAHRVNGDTREAHCASFRSMVRATGNQPTATT